MKASPTDKKCIIYIRIVKKIFSIQYKSEI